nr:PREDICTED: caspase-8-like [Latimeria chalumnae]|eukprot:XP_014343563.1 PREDICTED: caspase-8-like [Latimeria chalumnae]
MTFHDLLHDIQEDLCRENIAALKFLCHDFIPQRIQQRIVDGCDLFVELQNRNVLAADDTFLLAELLYKINRNDLLKKYLKLKREKVEEELCVAGKAKINPYRKLLFDLSLDITEEELKRVKFLLAPELKRSPLEQDVTILEVLIRMEKKGILEEGKLEYLKNICGQIRVDLVKKIENYEQQMKDLQQQGTQPLEMSFSQVNFNEDTYACRTVTTLVFNDEVYKMESRPCGYCVIINNFDFKKSRESTGGKMLKDRPGTHKDGDDLRSTFEWLHFEVDVHTDLTAENILLTVEDYKRKDHRERDCFVFCILTHGEKGTVYGTDGQSVPISDITSCFTGKNCPSLVGKPKVFFIQACRGRREQEGVPVDTDCKDSSFDPQPESDAIPSGDIIPIWADYLVGFSTMEEYVSFRDKKKGSFYIESLCKYLQQCCPRKEDILSILTKVNNEVSQKFQKQMPEPKFTLTKKLIFPASPTEYPGTAAVLKRI